MGQVLHGNARTTQAVRRSLQRTQETRVALAERHGIDRKTVAKWRQRATVEDAPMGPEHPRSTVLSPEEEATVLAFRHTLLPLDGCLGPVPVQHALQPAIPYLKRSLQHHGISRLPELKDQKVDRFAAFYPSMLAGLRSAADHAVPPV